MTDYLLDTSVILRLVNPYDLQNLLAAGTVATLVSRGDEPVLVAQVLVEFWVVATRPTDVNGLGWTPQQTTIEINGLKSRFSLRPDPATVFETWFGLVQKQSVFGKRAHDLRLVATAEALGIPFLLTFNVGDFQGATKCTAVHPSII